MAILVHNSVQNTLSKILTAPKNLFKNYCLRAKSKTLDSVTFHNIT